MLQWEIYYQEKNIFGLLIYLQLKFWYHLYFYASDIKFWLIDWLIYTHINCETEQIIVL